VELAPSIGRRATMYSGGGRVVRFFNWVDAWCGSSIGWAVPVSIGWAVLQLGGRCRHQLGTYVSGFNFIFRLLAEGGERDWQSKPDYKNLRKMKNVQLLTYY
jgi:hypothetical protein